MPVAQITTDVREAGRFAEQYDTLIAELRRQGFVVTRARAREQHGRAEENMETTIHLLEQGVAAAELADEVSDIRRAALRCLHGTPPGSARRLVVYGPQGQHLLDLSIPTDE
jgi:hypothetical protein